MQSYSSHKRMALWDPLGSNRFVVGGGGDIKLHSWDPAKREIRRLAVQTDLSLMKCLAWSPHHSYDDLMAVGLSTGRVDILRLTTNMASAQSAPNSFPNPPVASLPVRHSRACNALAFSSVDPNYLAVGLDKVRHDPSLVVWDIETAAASLSPPVNSPDARSPRFSQRLPTRIPPIDSRPNEPRPLQQYGSTEAITSLTFVPSSAGPSLLMAGVGMKWLRLHDLRSPTTSTILTIATKAVYGLCPDPFDDFKVASFGDDGGIRIWDRRRSSEPVIAFSEADASGDGGRLSILAEIAFSPTRRGLLGSLERDSSVVRFWDLISNVPVEEADHSRLNFPDNGGFNRPVKSDMGDRWRVDEELPPPILSHTRKGPDFRSAISSFAFVLNDGPSYDAPNILMASRKGDIAIAAARDPVVHAWGSNGDLTASKGPACKTFDTSTRDTKKVEPWEISIQGPSTLAHAKDESRTGRSTSPLRQSLLAAPGTLSLTRTRQTKSRTYSPSSMRQLPASRNGALGRSPSRRQTITNGKPRPLIRANGKVSKQHSSVSDDSMDDEDMTWRNIHGDVSLVMKRRVLLGYGLESMVHNASIVRNDDVLAGIWEWVELSREILGTSRTHDFNFAFQGILAIWEGFPPTPPVGREEGVTSHSAPATAVSGPPSSRSKKRNTRAPSPSSAVRSQFDSAVKTLISNRERHSTSATLVNESSTKDRRRLALALCKWDFTMEEFVEEMRTWEKHGWYSKTACWAVFIQDYQYAVDCLARSPDERHRILASTVAGLVPSVDTGEKGTNAQARIWREQCERTGLRLEDPYLRAMMSHLLADGWWDLLQEEQLLPLRDRLAIALSFLDDIHLSSYLREVTGNLKKEGSLEGLLLTGLTDAGVDVLQSYVDSTGDVQTAAILATLVSPVTFKDVRVERWVGAYEDLLDKWSLFHFRCQFDIARGHLFDESVRDGEAVPFEWAERQLLVRCNYCNKVVNSQQPLEVPSHNSSAILEVVRSNCCQTCRRTLAKCIICLMAVSVPSDSRRNAELAFDSSERDTIDDALIFCQTCRHGGHASHILDWFVGGGGPAHSVCAAADCSCKCFEFQ